MDSQISKGQPPVKLSKALQELFTSNPILAFSPSLASEALQLLFATQRGCGVGRSSQTGDSHSDPNNYAKRNGSRAAVRACVVGRWELANRGRNLHFHGAVCRNRGA